jgi:hypothetical protein
MTGDGSGSSASLTQLSQLSEVRRRHIVVGKGLPTPEDLVPWWIVGLVWHKERREYNDRSERKKV